MKNNLTKKGYGSKDSIVACDHQQDLYYSIRNPRAPVQPCRTEVISKDSMESLQKTLETDVQAKLQRGKSGEGSSGFLLVLKAGKVVFMALVFPVYITVYALPRYVLTKVVPAVFHTLYRPVGKTLLLGKRAALAVSRHLEKIQAFLKAKEKKPSPDRKKPLFLHLVASYFAFQHTLRQALLAPFFLVCKLHRNICRFGVNVNKHIDRKSKRLAKGAYRIQTLGKWLLESMANYVVHGVLRPVVQWMERMRSIVNDFFCRLGRQVEGAFRLVRTLVVSFLENPRTFLAKANELVFSWVFQIIATITGATTELIRKFAQEISSILCALRASAYDSLVDRVSLLRKELQAWLVNLHFVSKRAFISFLKGVIVAPWRIVLSTWQRRAKTFQRGREGGRRKFQVLKKTIVNNLVEKISALKCKSTRVYCIAARALMELLRVVEGRLRVLSDLLLRWLGNGLHVASLLLWKIYYRCRVGIAWGVVLSRDGMQLVRQAAEKFLR